MIPTRPRLPLDHAVRHALVEAVKLKLPPGQPMTIDTLEAAAVQLLRELGPQLLEDVIAGVEADPKKGALPAAVASPRTSKACARAHSSR
jgi:hypothetical protein